MFDVQKDLVSATIKENALLVQTLMMHAQAVCLNTKKLPSVPTVYHQLNLLMALASGLAVNLGLLVTVRHTVKIVSLDIRCSKTHALNAQVTC